MPDDYGTTPQADNSQEPATGAPQTQDTQAPDNGGQPALPDKFAGKSAVEIYQAYQELERKLGEQGQELSQYRMMPQPQQPPYPYYPQPPAGYPYGAPVAPPKPEIKMNWDNPVETFREIARSEVTPMVTNYQINTARNLGEIALANAKASDPALFDGVESQVKNFVSAMVDNGVLNPESALNPQTWAMAAWQMQGMKSGYKRTAAGPVPMQPVRTEMPGSRPPYAGPAPTPLNEADRRMMDKMGITEEQARKQFAGRR